MSLIKGLLKQHNTWEKAKGSEAKAADQLLFYSLFWCQEILLWISNLKQWELGEYNVIMWNLVEIRMKGRASQIAASVTDQLQMLPVAPDSNQLVTCQDWHFKLSNAAGINKNPTVTDQHLTEPLIRNKVEKMSRVIHILRISKAIYLNAAVETNLWHFWARNFPFQTTGVGWPNWMLPTRSCFFIPACSFKTSRLGIFWNLILFSDQQNWTQDCQWFQTTTKFERNFALFLCWHLPTSDSSVLFCLECHQLAHFSHFSDWLDGIFSWLDKNLSWHWDSKTSGFS